MAAVPVEVDHAPTAAAEPLGVLADDGAGLHEAVGDDVKEDFDAALVSGVDELLEVGGGAEDGIEGGGVDDGILRPDVVEVMGVAEGVAGEPDAGDAEVAEVRQTGTEGVEGAALRAVGRGEAAGGDLIDDQVFHPGGSGRLERVCGLCGGRIGEGGCERVGGKQWLKREKRAGLKKAAAGPGRKAMDAHAIAPRVERLELWRLGCGENYRGCGVGGQGAVGVA